jgi:hypothetical protein
MFVVVIVGAEAEEHAPLSIQLDQLQHELEEGLLLELQYLA